MHKSTMKSALVSGVAIINSIVLLTQLKESPILNLRMKTLPRINWVYEDSLPLYFSLTKPVFSKPKRHVVDRDLISTLG